MKIKRRTLASLIVWGIRVAVVVTLLGIFLLYTRTEIFTITSYDIVGVDDETRQLIINDLRDVVRQPVYFIVPGNKIFTYSTEAFTRTVHSNVTDLETIDMRPVGLHTVKITVTKLVPLFRVSDTEAISLDGIIFSTKKDIHTYPSIAIASSTKETFKRSGILFTHAIQNEAPIDAIFLSSLAEFTDKVSSIVFPVRSILVEPSGDITLYNASGTSKVMFLKGVSQKKVWSTLVSAIDTDPLKSKLKTEKEKLEYLDVRYGNKVFYRFSDMTFQNNKSTAIMDNHATTTSVVTATTSQR